MRVVSIGDLVTDYYYKNNKLLGVNGGMSSHNIIANLSILGKNTAVIGVVGDDTAGKVALKSLEDIGVDISEIKIEKNVKTRCFHISYNEENEQLITQSKKKCPKCNNKKWYERSELKPSEVIQKLNKDDILVFDNLNEINQNIIDNTKNLKIIDLGQYNEFENLSDNEIKLKLYNKFEIINLNERVSKYLIDKFKFNDEGDLYNLTNSTLITITKGNKGASFVFNGKVLNFELKKASKEIDNTGAGDAFVASILNEWIDNDLLLVEENFDDWYKKSVKLTNKVVKKIGARGHINSLYRVKSSLSSICNCESFEIVARKKIKRCNININNLEIRLLNALKSNVIEKMGNINFSKNGNYLFVGTGGSYASAKLSAKVVNKFVGSNTWAILPRDVKYRNNINIDKIFLFSYSGTTSDLIESTKEFPNENKFLFTKGEYQKIILKTGINKNNIISYRTNSNKGKERGFLSFEGAIAPALLFMSYFYDDVNFENFIKDAINYWNNYFNQEMVTKILKKMFEDNMLNIFIGDNTETAGCDFESKVIESGICNCILHEKKNFSHGRFINYENLGNKNSIYFKQKSTDKYEKILLEYLKNGNTLLVESRYDNLLCELDLLISSQILIYYIGKLLDIDVSKPSYSENAMKIYFYKGEF